MCVCTRVSRYASIVSVHAETCGHMKMAVSVDMHTCICSCVVHAVVCASVFVGVLCVFMSRGVLMSGVVR